MQIQKKAKEIRKEARDNLKGHWGQAIGIYIVFTILAGIIPEILNFTPLKALGGLNLFWSYPLTFGLAFYFLNLQKKSQKFSDLFSRFKGSKCGYWKSIGVMILFSIGALITALLLIIAVVALTMHAVISGAHTETLHQQMIQNDSAAFIAGVIIGVPLCIAIAIILLLPCIFYSYTYCMTFYISISNPELGVWEAFTASRRLMKGNRWRMFCMQISFVWWNILCVFTLFIAYIWICPYMNAANVAFYRSISDTFDFNGHILNSSTNGDAIVSDVGYRPTIEEEKKDHDAYMKKLNSK